jgi:hypothetical protein
MFNNEVWSEKIGTARQFALAQPNVVHSMEPTLVIHGTSAGAARVRPMQNKKLSLVAAPFREIKRS